MAESPNCPDGRPGAAILQSIITEAAALSEAQAETVDVRQFADGLLRIRLQLIADMGRYMAEVLQPEVADVGQIQKESN